MPIVNALVPAGQPRAARQAFLKAATQAVVDSVAAPIGSVRVLLQEISQDNVLIAGESIGRSALITVALITGRSDDAKAALIAAMNEAAIEHLGADGNQVRVVLYDIPSSDMGMANGKSAKSMGR
ncbi:MAG: tautomerase family protein [Burkholderiaceae bacterium]|nr:tautomerase family protein [Burkholderiaceae bacterium]